MCIQYQARGIPQKSDAKRSNLRRDDSLSSLRQIFSFKHDKMTLDSRWAWSHAYQTGNQSFQHPPHLSKRHPSLQSVFCLNKTSNQTWNCLFFSSFAMTSLSTESAHVMTRWSYHSNHNTVGMCHPLCHSRCHSSLSVHLVFMRSPSSWFFHHFLSILFLWVFCATKSLPFFSKTFHTHNLPLSCCFCILSTFLSVLLFSVVSLVKYQQKL